MIDFTKWTNEERKMMVEIIDLAVRQAGVNVVQRSFILLNKIREAEIAEQKSNVLTLNIPQDGTAGAGGGSG
jgi:hypothetical protein